MRRLALLLAARGPDNPARNVARGEKDALLAAGYALAGSSYARTGWAIEEAVPDQLATLAAPDAGLPVLLTSSGEQMRADLAAWPT